MQAPSELLLLCAIAAAAPLPAQGEPEERDWRMPFRNPAEALDAPADVFAELRTMFAIARDPAVPKHFDETGVEVCDDDGWHAARARLLGLSIDAGHISQVIRLSGSLADRQLALYGMFYIPDSGLVMQLLNHVPGEPVRKLREDGMRRAIEFLRVHLPRKNPGDLEEWSKVRIGPAGELPPKPGEWTHEFDAVPYFVLLTMDSPLDQLQALWFLGEVVRIRPDLWKPYLAAAAPTLYPLVRHDDLALREGARTFAMLVDPEQRPAPPADEPDALADWLDEIMYDVFPPIRPIGPGLVDLYASEDLDRIVAVGKRLLGDGSFGDPETGTLPDGQAFRGLRIARMPEPLDKLGLELGQVITAINGVPVTTCDEVLAAIEESLWKRSFFVEYVSHGRLHAKEFRRAD